METQSPINKKKLQTQNDKVLHLLQTKESVTLFDGLKIGILHFHSRIADVRKQATIYDRMTRVKDYEGNQVNVKEYSLNPFL